MCALVCTQLEALAGGYATQESGSRTQAMPRTTLWRLSHVGQSADRVRSRVPRWPLTGVRRHGSLCFRSASKPQWPCCLVLPGPAWSCFVLPRLASSSLVLPRPISPASCHRTLPKIHAGVLAARDAEFPYEWDKPDGKGGRTDQPAAKEQGGRPPRSEGATQKERRKKAIPTASASFSFFSFRAGQPHHTIGRFVGRK